MGPGDQVIQLLGDAGVSWLALTWVVQVEAPCRLGGAWWGLMYLGKESWGVVVV